MKHLKMNKQDKIYKNPFNFHGSKERILPLIKQNLPQNCTMMVDMFGGSGTLCVNTDFAMYIYNEKNKYMYNLFNTIKNCEIDFILEHIEDNVNFYGLSKNNKQAFLNFRKDFNNKTCMFLDTKEDWYRNVANIDLYTLICYSFNYMLVFNKEGKYSVPSGYRRSSFNNSIKNKLIEYNKVLKYKDIQTYNYDFRELYQQLCSMFVNDFNGVCIFVDPPYSLTDDLYSRTSGMKWSLQDDADLHNVLKDIDKKGGRFIYTNQLQKGENINQELLTFSKRYNTINTNCDFSNCSYQRSVKGNDKEVLIKNY